MASRNSDGTRILKSENDKGARHTGENIVIGRSDNDTVDVRQANTSFRPGRSG